MSTSLLQNDLYEFTMASSYFERKMNDMATFEFFIRPQLERSYFVTCGVQSVVDFVESFTFDKASSQFLGQLGFNYQFLEYLQGLRFTGDIMAMPEGTIAFPNEPILQVTAPLLQAQLFEPIIINLIHYQTLVATKASRCVMAAQGRRLVDFGLRRTHSLEAADFAARACYLAGFAATSNVSAGLKFEIPVAGTMAHSYIQAHNDETDAFLNFARSNPHNPVLLVDTFDTETGVHNAAQAALALKLNDIRIKAIRIDSGDLDELSRKARFILDSYGLIDVQIYVSGGLDEWEIYNLVSGGAPVDGFGLGTKINTSADLPYLDCAYKLVEYKRTPRLKLSTGKALLPGKKQVFRQLDRSGKISLDTIALAEERHKGLPLLQAFIQNGEPAHPQLNAIELRHHFRQNLSMLPHHLRFPQDDKSPSQFVKLSSQLRRLCEKLSSKSTMHDISPQP